MISKSQWCDIISGEAQGVLFSSFEHDVSISSLKADIVDCEMVIIIHESSTRVQDKHFIRLLLPNNMTQRR